MNAHKSKSSDSLIMFVWSTVKANVDSVRFFCVLSKKRSKKWLCAAGKLCHTSPAVFLPIFLGLLSLVIYITVRCSLKRFIIYIRSLILYWVGKKFFAFFSKKFFLFFNLKNTTSFQQCMLHYYLWLVANALAEKGSHLRRSLETFGRRSWSDPFWGRSRRRSFSRPNN